MYVLIWVNVILSFLNSCALGSKSSEFSVSFNCMGCWLKVVALLELTGIEGI